MSSTVKKEKSKLIKEKKEKKKKSKDHGANIPNENHEEIKKSNILSALDKIDNKSKEETRFIEEKLRAGLIKSERSKTVEDIEKEINEIKKKIENLRKLKDEHDKKGEFDEAIEISKKIITVAFSNNLKVILNEEKKFLDLIEKKVTQKFETIQILEKKSDSGSTKQEILNIDTTKEKASVKLNKARFQENKKFEEEKRKFMEEKEAFKWEKQMLEELKKHERDKGEDTSKEKIELEVEKVESDEKKKFEEEKLNFEREKAKFEQEKLKFEEKRESFKQERLKFNEDKEAFKWEKQMFEEMKKFERDREKSIDVKED